MMASRYSVPQSSSERGYDAAVGGAGRRVAPDLAARLDQRRDQRRQMRRRAGLVDQQRLGRAAHARPAHLGVDGDLLRHGEIGGGVNIDVADAVEMREDRHPRLLLDAGHKALAAARHDHVDRAVEPGQHHADRFTVGAVDDLDRRLGRAPPAASPRPGAAWIARLEFSPSEPPRRITALPAFRHRPPASAVTFGRLS